jgi:hypothetical protein
MEVLVQRRIRSGKEYDHLFPKASGTEITVISGDADVEDTIDLMKKIINETLEDTAKISKVLKGKDVYDTCSNIWHFVKNHIKYKKDKHLVEQIRRPRRSWADRTIGVDCDCYSVFIASCLLNNNIDCILRITAYGGKPYFQHVYPIVPINGKYR